MCLLSADRPADVPHRAESTAAIADIDCDLAAGITSPDPLARTAAAPEAANTLMLMLDVHRSRWSRSTREVCVREMKAAPPPQTRPTLMTGGCCCLIPWELRAFHTSYSGGADFAVAGGGVGEPPNPPEARRELITSYVCTVIPHEPLRLWSSAADC